MKRKNAAAGFATVEFGMTAGLIVLTLAGAAWIVKAQWDRDRCAYFAFQAAHESLMGALSVGWKRETGFEVHLWEDPNNVHAEAICGDAKEAVTLAKLPRAQWR